MMKMVRDEVIAVIDAGTTGVRTILYDSSGKELGKAYKEHKSYFDKTNWVEQKAKEWYESVKETSKDVIKKAKIKNEQIIGISITNQRETIVPVSEKGEALRRAIVWQDRRSIDECAQIEKIIGYDKINEITGLTINSYFSGPKILWIKKNHPEIFKKTHKFLLVHDYLIHKLTGVFISDWSNASRTMLFDINNFEWSDYICDKLEIPIEKMPKPVPSGKKVGEITNKSSRETGFMKGTLVISGGGDQQCAAVGNGVIKPGRVKVTTGTGSFILAAINKLIRDPERRILTTCHAIPKKYVLEASVFTTGAIYRWFRDNLGFEERKLAEDGSVDPYEILNELCEKHSKLGGNGLLLIPHFAGAGAPYWDSLAKGVLLGLSLEHTKYDIIRAIFEAVGFEIKKNIELFKDMGIDIQEIRITGGGTRSAFWNQIQADIYGIPVLRVSTEETTALGCAVLVGVGTGIYKDFNNAIENMIKIEEKLDPNKENHKKYNKLFKINKKIYNIMRENNVYTDLNRFLTE
ncbi:MAG: xylulokinase [Candidatus Lokiarchaeota archaeon]|nr:xylulokinase [Candidatus Lokiarchaeota archaeon]